MGCSLSKTEAEEREDEIKRLQLELDKSRLSAHRAYGEALTENRSLKLELSGLRRVSEPLETHR